MMIRAGELKEQEYGLPCTRVKPTRHMPDMLETVRNGLLESPRTIPTKYFYDDRGSMLFDRICETDEYYPTRTEDSLLSKHGVDIIAESLPDQIIELGSGSSVKTRRLFDACEVHTHICGYAPFDVCEPVLTQTACDLWLEYQWLQITPLLGDYLAGLGNLPATEGVRMFVFLGSTIGNFPLDEAREFIREIRDCMRPGDYFLLGADRVKDSNILNAAYNDAEGLTAEFNLNVLNVLNREMNADFDPAGFAHQAAFNKELSRIEMHLVSKRDQEVHLGKIEMTISLSSEEKILTEISRKFRFSELETMLETSGFNIINHFESANHYFSLILSRLN